MSSRPLLSSTTTEFRKGDEVATVFGGRLVFGTLEYPNQAIPGEWTINWNDDIWCQSVAKKRHQNDMVVTDRALYRGCKVRRADKSTNLTGVCRSVTLSADIRIVGTSTILPATNSTNLSHLKEFKQKSVVYERGWLGIITEVERMAKIRFHSGLVNTVPLSDILKTSTYTVESPWVNEGVICTILSLKKANVDVKDILAHSQSQNQGNQRVYIEDIEVISVKVAWRFQVDLMCPDSPPSRYNGVRLKNLNVVREDFCTESTFHVGNLCRYKVRMDNEFLSQLDFEKRLVQEYFPSRLEQLDPSMTSNRAYDKDPESRIAPGKICVVELVHLTGTGDIIWQDGTMEFMKSLDLIVLEESLIDTVLIPGDFIFSKEIRRKIEDVYLVVQRTDLKKKQVYVNLLTCTSPPRVLDYNLCLEEGKIIPHPRYKYFNETNTIAVMNTSKSIRVGHVQGTNLIGKVSVRWQDTGKEEWCWPAECSIFSVKGYDLECIINLVIGEDEISQDPKTKLQVILNRLKEINLAWNNINDNEIDYLAQSIVKLKCLISEIISIELNIGRRGEYFSHENISDEKTQRMTCLSTEYFQSTTEPIKKEFTELTKLIESCTLQLMTECSNTIEKLSTFLIPSTSSGSASTIIQSQTSSSSIMDHEEHVIIQNENHHTTDIDNQNHIMEIDDSAIETDCSGNVSPTSNTSIDEEQQQQQQQQHPSCPQVEFPDCFRPNVVVDDDHPECHIYAKSQFEQQHARYFIKIVKDELNNLRDSCPPGIKVKAYGSRYDLFSIMIGGPKNTPYENTLYLFDAVMPTSYPSVPPKFHFHAYGAGRLNPNLYAEGKVCVSLLGTWSSPLHQEKWTKESNIAQVLLSIQALILVNEPYHNEPGLEAHQSNENANRANCLEYNTVLIPKVVEMMMNQIRNPMDPWKEEINSFYKENIPKFISRWKKWLAGANLWKIKSLTEFNSKLSEEDIPGFAIWPISNNLQKQMTAYMKILENLHASICTDGTQITTQISEPVVQEGPSSSSSNSNLEPPVDMDINYS